jgi:hypothetical protein
MSEKSIKETLELLNSIEVISISFVKAFKDGKINLEDLPIFFELMKEAKTIIDGIQGIKEIPEEIKDLEEREAAAIGIKLYAILARLKKEIKEK